MLSGRTVVKHEPPSTVVFYEGEVPMVEFYWEEDEAYRRAERRAAQGYKPEVMSTEEVLRRMRYDKTVMLEVDDAPDA